VQKSTVKASVSFLTAPVTIAILSRVEVIGRTVSARCIGETLKFETSILRDFGLLLESRDRVSLRRAQWFR
jgi:hypothetical protein